jgi:2-iminobutanoate/2-iminopropanoate deaminase
MFRVSMNKILIVTKKEVVHVRQPLFIFFIILLFSFYYFPAQNKKIIFTDKAPAPIGAYSQAVKAEELLFISGQVALTTDGKMDTLSIEAETKRVMENLKEILSAAKMNFNHVVKTTIYLTDLKNFQKVNEVYSSYFKTDFPARETVEVKALPKGAHIEIAMTAAE